MKKSLLALSFILQFFFTWAHKSDSTQFIIRKDSTFHFDIEAELVTAESDILEEGLVEISNDSVQRYIDLARTVIDKIKESKSYITSLDSISKFNLPRGISKTIGGVTYTLGIHAVRLKPTYAELDVVMEFVPPQSEERKPLYFKANGIKLSYAGGIVGNAQLELLGNYGFNFNGGKIQLLLKGSKEQSGTYVKIDCDGFKEMGLDADIIFSRDLLVPENLNGTIQTDGRVSASFLTVLSSWNDLIVQISLPNFQVTKLNGFGFSIQNAVFDFSDLRNAPGAIFPAGYQTETEPDLDNLWRGIYAREISVRLPNTFKNKDNVRTTFSATDLIIDNQGVSGNFSANNLIPLKSGDMNGWAFSVESLSMKVVANHIQEGKLKGSIVVPVSDEQTPFHYSASFSDNNQYLFVVSTAENMQFKLWQTSKVDIYKASRLEINVIDGKFMPKAVLHGQMSINASLSENGQGLTLADLKFENLEIQSVKPYIKIGNFSFGTEGLQQKMAGFPIGIKEVGMRQVSETQTGLDFSLLLNLTGENSGSFAADAGLTIVGGMEVREGSQTWKFKEVEVRSIAIDINQGDAFKLKGSIIFYKNDPVYGDGFNGAIDATFLSKLTIKGSAIFGCVDGQRYWYVDAMATFKPGIPFMPGVAFYGFGGGIYQYMRMSPDGSGSPLGRTTSGIVYTPDKKTFLGLKAIVNIGSSPNDQAFTADVTFEITFFKGGGIRTISMTGNAYIATPALGDKLSKLTESAKKLAGSFDALEQKANQSLPSMGGLASSVVSAEQDNISKSIFGDIGDAAGDKGSISAHAFIQYDFENKELHGNFNVRVNIANGIILGNGDAVLHFAPHEWYVYVGTPDHRFFLSLGIGSIKVNATSYFMVGSKIPASPPPPEAVSRILGNIDLDYMKDLNTIAAGGGFAFGASFEIDTGDLTFLMFYARLHAGTGFDIMLKNYGDTYCAGSNKRIGINGWYANGQSYAFVEGSVGIRIKVFGKKKNVEILSLGAATILQAQLPNPFWMRGIVGGYFSILGGLVKGQCKFEVTLGKKCEFETKVNTESALDNFSVITQLTPAAGETNVNVFNTPQVVFNMPVDKSFEIINDDGTNRPYKIKLDYYRLQSDNQDLVGTFEWNYQHDVVAFNSFEVLPPKKEVKVMVQVSFEEFKNNSWVKVLENGQPMIERLEQSFTTGTAPDYIPLSNVEYSYPVISQLNFYKDESAEGYVKLKKGQGYLFEPSDEWQQTGRFAAATGSKTDCRISYANQTISYTIPYSSLSTNTLYSFEFLNVPKSQSGAVDRNINESTNQIATADASLNLEVKSREAEGSIAELQVKSIYSCTFRTSSFNNFSKKIESLAVSLTRAYGDITNPYNQKVFSRLSGVEYFDQAEIIGSEFTARKPIIKMETELSGNNFYATKVFPLVYEGYPLNGNITITNRVPSDLGVPPTKACYVSQTPASLTIDNLNQNGSTATVSGCEYIFDLPRYMYYDFKEIQTKVAQQYVNYSNPPNRMLTIMLGRYPMIDAMRITYKINHVLPGTGKITTSKTVVINY